MKVFSLGAGVQSSCMALMAMEGEIEAPDVLIFADTGDEPSAVYRHLAWLIDLLPYDVQVVSEGRGLLADLKQGEDRARVPFFIAPRAMAKRQCTRNYKIRPIRREVRRRLGRPGRCRIAPGTVEQFIGISTDEAWRMRPSDVAFIENRYPLIDRGMSRQDCLSWMDHRGYPRPPKSRCKYCPYQSPRDLAALPPEELGEVVALDDWLGEPGQVERFHGRLYVHPARKPIREAMAQADQRSLDLWAEECHGMCGL